MKNRVFYDFDSFRVDAAKRLLSRDGAVAPLPPKAFDMLLVLLENRDRVLDKDELLKALWPDTFVEEANLTQNISVLRKALGESPHEHRYIVTLPGRGYRFAATVTESREDTGLVIEEEARARITIDEANLPDTGPINSIAVFPLVNASGEPSGDYLCDGMTEGIINTLSQIAQLHVLARNTVFRYKGRDIEPKVIGRELGVGAILTGRLVSQQRRLIISVELVEVATGWQLWGAQFNRKAADVLSVQEEISREVSEKLQLQLTLDEQRRLQQRQTGNFEAYRSYIRGRYFLNKRLTETLRQAIGYFQQATDHDPEYALAYVGLADAYALLSLYGALRPREAFPKSKAAAMKALDLDANLSEAHNSLGVVELFYERNWSGAEQSFRRALELNSNYADAHQRYGIYLTAMERFDEASVELEKAQELDPLSLINSTIAGYPAYYSRQYDRAVSQFRQTLELDPNFSMAHFRLGLTYLEQSKYETALIELQTSRSLSNDRDVVAALARLYAKMGDVAQSKKLITELHARSKTTFVPSYDLAVVHAALGEEGEALAWLEKAVQERSYWVIYLKVDPALDSLRAELRFAELQARAGLS